MPEENVLYVPSRTNPDIVRLEKVEGLRTFSDYAFFKDDSEYVDGLPLTKPPYGRITAIDLDTGEHIWMSPVGKGPVNHEALRDLDLPALGWFHYNYILATETVLVVVSQRPEWWGDVSGDAFVEKGPYLRAFDLDTGAVLAEMKFPGQPNGSPISYMANGSQYIVFPINDDEWVPQLLALALPE